MSRPTAIALLAAAALLEAGGDAIIRAGLKTQGISARLALFLLGALVLFAYGYTVNAPSWNFGQLLGLYVVFFFLAAQLIAWLAFAQAPNGAVLLGGILIISGGLVIALWRT